MSAVLKTWGSYAVIAICLAAAIPAGKAAFEAGQAASHKASAGQMSN